MRRQQHFNDLTKPIIDLYRRFGMVREVNGNNDENVVYEDTRKAMLPSMQFIIGPPYSNKTTIAQKLCERTNTKLLNFCCFLKERGLCEADDEKKTSALIHHLYFERAPRVLLENFPQTEMQAKYFFKNVHTNIPKAIVV